MTNEAKLRKIMYEVLEFPLNRTASHRTDFPMKESQSLHFILNLDEHTTVFEELADLIGSCPFLKIKEVNDNTLEKWSPFGISKPVPFEIVIQDFKDLMYDYDGCYTFMKFKFGGRNYILPIEKIEDTYNGSY